MWLVPPAQGLPAFPAIDPWQEYSTALGRLVLSACRTGTTVCSLKKSCSQSPAAPLQALHCPGLHSAGLPVGKWADRTLYTVQTNRSRKGRHACWHLPTAIPPPMTANPGSCRQNPVQMKKSQRTPKQKTTAVAYGPAMIFPTNRLRSLSISLSPELHPPSRYR